MGGDGWGEIKSEAIQRNQAFETIYPLVMTNIAIENGHL